MAKTPTPRRRPKSLRESDYEVNQEALRLQKDVPARNEFKRAIKSDPYSVGPSGVSRAKVELDMRGQSERHRKHGWGESYSKGVAAEEAARMKTRPAGMAKGGVVKKKPKKK